MNTQNNINPINTLNLSNQNIPSLNDLSEKYQTGIIGTLISLYFQILNTLAKYGINNIAEFVSLNPNLGAGESLKEITSNVRQIKDMLKTPEGKELLKELSDLLLVAFKELDGPINELTNIMNKLINKEMEVSQRLILNQIKIVLGPIGSIIQIISSMITATENMTDATAQATGIFKEEVKKFNEIKTKIQLWLEKLKNASKSGPESLKERFNAAKGKYDLQSSINKMKGNMNNYASKLKPRFSGYTVNPSQIPMLGGKKNHQTFIHIQKGGKQTAKRTKKSISEFLNSGIRSSQIIKMINGKGNGKTRRKRLQR
jgi:hypothetical protein